MRSSRTKRPPTTRRNNMFFRHRCAAVVLLVAVSHLQLLKVTAYTISPKTGWVVPSRISTKVSPTRLQVSTRHSAPSTSNAADDDDEALLKQVGKSQLQDLCRQYSLSTDGTKEVLLKRLRDYANEQAEMERKRQKERITRVEQGGENDKERYEIVNDYPEDDDEEGYFYFYAPGNFTANNETASTTETKPKVSKPTYLNQNTITAPPPPEPNENGERVVTVYSTKEHNDLTGVAAAQPGFNALSNDAMMAGSESSKPAPWDMQDRQSEASSKELEEAKETVTELVHVLLTMTGAPAFREEFSEGLTPMEEMNRSRKGRPIDLSPEGFVGFDPAKVPTDILVASSQALRAGRGQVLQDVLRDYELRAIGHDGMAGDDEEKGGGHYREVSKVRAFLEGYRRAEVRRVARETATVLLDKLVSEGIEGLDFLLASMTKTSDDDSRFALNDALLDYLNDAIRQQEKKVEQLVASRPQKINGELVERHEAVDKLEALWNVTNEDGVQVETLDPNDPRVQNALKEENSRSQLVVEGSLGSPRATPETASEQLLLLLTLLRERIKAEAAFASDEKGRNLRILAYCLHVSADKDREEIIRKEVGTSVDVSALSRVGLSRLPSLSHSPPLVHSTNSDLTRSLS